jgi:hypothetical protein
MDSKEELPQSEPNEEKADYAAPRIESVMTPEALAREVQYAGSTDATVGVPEG